MKKSLNLQSSFRSIDTSWKDKNSYNIDWNSQNGDKSLKNFSSTSINFHCFKSKTSDLRLNPLMFSVSFLYPLKTSEKRMLSDVSRGYNNATLDINGLRRPWSRERKLLIFQCSSKTFTQNKKSILNYIYLL